MQDTPTTLQREGLESCSICSRQRQAVISSLAIEAELSKQRLSPWHVDRATGACRALGGNHAPQHG